MSQFPNAIPTYDPFTTPITLQAFQHTSRHAQMEEDIAAIATKVGIDGSADTDSIDYMLAQILTDKIDRSETDASGFDFVLDEDDLSSDSATKLATQQSIKAYVDAAIAANNEAMHPVGSYYFNEDDPTNPATLLGFGTWVAAARGRVPVGEAASGTFDSAGATGGAETHTLTTAEMPSHAHDVNGGSNNDYIGTVGGGQGGWGIAGSTNNNIYRTNVDAVGGGGAHNNLQPYIVVYIWKRTA